MDRELMRNMFEAELVDKYIDKGMSMLPQKGDDVSKVMDELMSSSNELDQAQWGEVERELQMFVDSLDESTDFEVGDEVKILDSPGLRKHGQRGHVGKVGRISSIGDGEVWVSIDSEAGEEKVGMGYEVPTANVLLSDIELVRKAKYNESKLNEADPRLLNKPKPKPKKDLPSPEEEDEDLVLDKGEDEEAEDDIVADSPEDEDVAEIDFEKLYLGRTEDKHFYVVADKSEYGEVTDLKVVDQEGELVFSLEDTETDKEDIRHFIEAAIEEVDIAQIERSVVMQYIIPEVEEELLADEEDEFDEDDLGTEELGGELESEEEELPNKPRSQSKGPRTGWESKTVVERHRFRVGDKARVSSCSGIDSNKIVTIKSNPYTKGHLRTKVVDIELPDGQKTYMFVNRLHPATKNEGKMKNKANEGKMGVDYVKRAKSGMKAVSAAMKEKDFELAAQHLQSVADECVDGAKALGKMKLEADEKARISAEKELQEEEDCSCGADVDARDTDEKCKGKKKVKEDASDEDFEKTITKVHALIEEDPKNELWKMVLSNLEDGMGLPERGFPEDGVEECGETPKPPRGRSRRRSVRKAEAELPEKCKGKKKAKKEAKDLEENTFTDEKGNEFSLNLVDEGSRKVSLQINNRTFNFNTEFAQLFGADEATGKI
jgi:hypothetical protein